MYWLVPCIPILRGGIKSARRMCIYDYAIFSIDTCEKCLFRFEKGYKRVIAPGFHKTYCYRYYKIGQLLQIVAKCIAAGITKYGNYYKLGHSNIFSVFLKFRTCYITGQWGRVHSKGCYFIFIYSFLSFFVVSNQKVCFYHFHFFLMKYRSSATEYCFVWLVVFPVNKVQRSHTNSYNITMI